MLCVPGAPVQLPLVAAACCCGLPEAARSERGCRGVRICHEPGEASRRQQRRYNQWVKIRNLARETLINISQRDTVTLTVLTLFLVQIWTSQKLDWRACCLACWIGRRIESCVLTSMTHWAICCHLLLWKSFRIGWNSARMFWQQLQVNTKLQIMTHYYFVSLRKLRLGQKTE